VADRRRVGRIGLVAVVVVLLANTLIPAAASAASPDSGRLEIDMSDGLGFTVNPHGSLIDTSRLVPGHNAAGTMGVRNGSADSADLGLKITDTTDLDNGCTRAERVVDPTCGSGVGQIGRELSFTVALADRRTGPYAPTWTGTAAQLARGISVARGVAAHTARWVRLDVALPSSSGNETQTDTFAFAVRVMLQSSFGVEGIQIGGGGVSTDSHELTTQGYLGLPFTGVKAVMLIGAAAFLVACGLLFVALGSVRRRGNAG
jgi:hypothetical protein